MTRQEFDKLIEMVDGCWPRQFTPTHIGILWDAVSSMDAKTLADAIVARAKCAGQTTLGHLIDAAKEVHMAKGARAAESKVDCRLCDGTGYVSTKDKDDYDFVFVCPRFCKPRPSQIPVWDAKYLEQGFRRV